MQEVPGEGEALQATVRQPLLREAHQDEKNGRSGSVKQMG